MIFARLLFDGSFLKLTDMITKYKAVKEAWAVEILWQHCNIIGYNDKTYSCVTLPYVEGVLPPGAEASSGPIVRPRINL